MTFNTMSSKLEAKQAIFTIIPQGWAFFTRNPREGQTLLYKIEDNKIVNANFKHNSFKYKMGLDRSCTKVYTELGFIKEKVPSDAFIPLEWNYQVEKLNNVSLESMKPFTVKNALKDPILNGKYLLVIQEPIPWAWSSNIEKIKMPAAGILLNVTK